MIPKFAPEVPQALANFGIGTLSVPIPTFVSFCSTLVYKRRNQRDTSNYLILVGLWI